MFNDQPLTKILCCALGFFMQPLKSPHHEHCHGLILALIMLATGSIGLLSRGNTQTLGRGLLVRTGRLEGLDTEWIQDLPTGLQGGQPYRTQLPLMLLALCELQGEHLRLPVEWANIDGRSLLTRDQPVIM